MARYDYSITVDRLVPPLGKNRFVAKFGYFYELTNGPDKSVTPPTPEGETEDEARGKLEANVEKWEKSGF